jgi:hypothetical protein
MMKRTMTVLITFGLLTASAARIGAVETSPVASIDAAPAVAEMGWAVSHWNTPAGWILGGATGGAAAWIGGKIGMEIGGLLGGFVGAGLGGALGGF